MSTPASCLCQASGANTDMIFAEESTWGTFVTDSSLWKGFRILPGESLASSINRFQSNELQPIRQVLNTAGGNIRAGGSIPFELSPEGFGTLFKHALGAIPVTTGSVGDYCHVLKAGNDFPCGGLSIEKRFNDIGKYLRYWGMRIDSFSLNVPQEGYVSGTFNFQGKGEISDEGAGEDPSFDIGSNTSDYGPVGQSVSPAAPFSTDEPFVPYSSVIQEGNPLASVVNIRSLSLNFANNWDADGFVISSRYRECMSPGKNIVTGNMSVFFKDMSFYNAFLDETRSGLRVYFARGTGPTKSTEFFLPRIEFTGESPKISSAGGLTLNIPFQALYDYTEETSLKITIRSTESYV